ncbi:MAG TPA: glycosyltransferase family 2 protein, partial [Geobacteraceae bacterium]
MGFRLSICIPTYNRVGLLRETLESIVSQAREGLEIVICDNASTDATPQLVEEFKGRFPAIRYFRWPENQGFDRNILKVVEEAHGDYCWLMGDDDHLEAGALERLFPLLEEGYGCIYVNAATYDREMTRCSGETIRHFACADADEMLLSIASWLTFVSSICVRRADFLAHLDSGLAHVGTGFAHCYPLVGVIRRARNHIVREPLVRFRAGNTGGYNIFRMFIEEFGRILAYCGELGYSPAVIEEIRTRNVYL